MYNRSGALWKSKQSKVSHLVKDENMVCGDVSLYIHLTESQYQVRRV